MKKTFSAALLASIMLVPNAFATELPKEATLEVKFELPELEVAMYARLMLRFGLKTIVAMWLKTSRFGPATKQSGLKISAVGGVNLVATTVIK